MKSLGVQATIFGCIVGGALIIGQYVRTISSLKNEVLDKVNHSLSVEKIQIGLNQTCAIRMSPSLPGILVCIEDVTGRTVQLMTVDASLIPNIVSQTIEIQDIRPLGDGTLNLDTGKLVIINNE